MIAGNQSGPDVRLIERTTGALSLGGYAQAEKHGAPRAEARGAPH